MVKKIIIAILTISLVLVFLAMPVSADETSAPYIELVDLCGVDGSARYSFALSANVSANHYMDGGIYTNNLTSVTAVEMTLAYSGSVAPDVTYMSFTSYTSGGAVPTVRTACEGVIRVRADTGTGGSRSSKVMFSMISTVDCSVTVLSCKLYITENLDTALPYFLYDGYNDYTTSRDAGVTGFLNWNSSSSSLTSFTAQVRVDDWRNYDSVSLYGRADVMSVLSVTCYMHNNETGENILIPINQPDFGDYVGSYNRYAFALCADLSGINHVDQPDSTLYFSFELNVNLYEGAYFYVFDLYGSVYSALDSESVFKMKVLDFVSDIYVLSNAISSRLSTYFPDFLEALQNISQGSNSAEAPAQSAQDKADELAGLGSAMEAGTPQIDANMAVTPGAIPNDGSQNLMTSFFDLLWSNSLMLSMITTVFAIATISYVFFGKKG